MAGIILMLFVGCVLLSVFEYDIPKKVPELQQVLRREFLKNKDVQDIRVIDMLVIKVSSH